MTGAAFAAYAAQLRLSVALVASPAPADLDPPASSLASVRLGPFAIPSPILVVTALVVALVFVALFIEKREGVRQGRLRAEKKAPVPFVPLTDEGQRLTVPEPAAVRGKQETASAGPPELLIVQDPSSPELPPQGDDLPAAVSIPKGLHLPVDRSAPTPIDPAVRRQMALIGAMVAGRQASSPPSSQKPALASVSSDDAQTVQFAITPDRIIEIEAGVTPTPLSSPTPMEGQLFVKLTESRRQALQYRKGYREAGERLERAKAEISELTSACDALISRNAELERLLVSKTAELKEKDARIAELDTQLDERVSRPTLQPGDVEDVMRTYLQDELRAELERTKAEHRRVLNELEEAYVELQRHRHFLDKAHEKATRAEGELGQSERHRHSLMERNARMVVRTQLVADANLALQKRYEEALKATRTGKPAGPLGYRPTPAEGGVWLAGLMGTKASNDADRTSASGTYGYVSPDLDARRPPKRSGVAPKPDPSQEGDASSPKSAAEQ